MLYTQGERCYAIRVYICSLLTDSETGWGSGIVTDFPVSTRQHEKLSKISKERNGWPWEAA